MQSSIKNLISRRHLLRILVSSNLKRQNKNTTLGYLWWLLDPILMTGVYYLLVAVLFRRGDGNSPYLMYLLLGLLSYKAFSGSLAQSVSMLQNQGAIIKAISFPKAVLPISMVLSNAVYFIVALLVAMGMGIYYGPEWGSWPNWYYLMLPLVISFQVMFTVGLALIVATLGVFFKDTANILGHLLRMWYFFSPGLYSLDKIPDHLLPYFRLNPFCELMTAYRDIMIFGRMPTVFDLGYSFITGVVSLLFGYWVFRRYEGRLVQKL